MKRKALVALGVAGLLAFSVPASAHRYNSNDDGHVLRLVAHAVNAVGVALDQYLMRPIHAFVSKPDMDIVFGHMARPGEKDTYHEWLHGDYTPSIGEVMASQKKASGGTAK